MSNPLLSTKLYIPPFRPGLVPRPRLLARLQAGLDCKLTLISSPPGFGKTTLLSEWVHARQQADADLRVAWLSLDEGDDDPMRFWGYVVAALQASGVPVGETVRAILRSPQQALLEPLVTALINEFAIVPAPVALVLDDYHLIEAEPIHRSVGFLLDHLPPHAHLLIATRSDPPFPLSRLRSRSDLVEIRTADLRFTAEETAEFLNAVLGLGLSAEDVAALEDRTEGWVVGLQLAALSLQGQADKHDLVAAFAGDDRYVVDYLVEQVLGQQPPQIHAFLLQTAILERLCGPLCDAVTGRNDGQTTLDYLEQANLFVVPLDNRRRWYRYHHLFSDLLTQRLRQSEWKSDLAQLHLRACAWYEQEGLVAEAVAHALAAPDHERAGDLVEQHAMLLFRRSEIVLTHRWLTALPDDLVRSRPRLCIARAFSTMVSSPLPPRSAELAEPWAQEAERALVGGLGGAGRADRDALASQVAVFRAYQSRFRGDDPRAVIALSRKALDSLAEDDLWPRGALKYNLGQACWSLGDQAAAERAFTEARRAAEICADHLNACAAIFSLSEIARIRGRLREAAAICREALHAADNLPELSERPAPYIGLVCTGLGRILLEWNDLQGAERVLTRGVELCALMGEWYYHLISCCSMARLRAAQGDLAGALAALDSLAGLSPVSAHLAASFRVRLWLAQAEDDPRCLAAALCWLREQEITLDAAVIYEDTLGFERLCNEHLTLARVLVAQRRAEVSAPPGERSDLRPLLQFLDRQFCLAEEGGRIERMVDISVVQALALQAQGDTPQAVTSLRRALVLAEPGGYVRIFVDEGPPMAALLAELAKPQRDRKKGAALDPVTGHAVELLAAFLAPRQGGAAVQRLVEPLSPRELQLLHLVAAGASNPEIAQELFLSVNTVKKHITNIFGKLGVTSRTQAVAQARRLGLIE